MIEWKKLPINQNYSISSEGVVRNDITGRIRKHNINAHGYPNVGIKNDDKGKYSVVFPHREVALLFVPNKDNLPQINHIDGDKTNPRKDNLEWVTPQQNVSHAIDNGLFDVETITKIATKASLVVNSKPLKVTDDKNNVEYFSSISDCSRRLNIKFSTLSRAVNNVGVINGLKIERI